jgi:hypothetical protein
MNNAVAEVKQGALASQSTGRMAVADIISHVATVQEVMKAVMKKDVHYGVIPGTDKPTLLKPGAEVLCMAFRIADRYEIEDLSEGNTVRYRVTCVGSHQTMGTVLGSGMGEASSGEEKYKWRKAWDDEFDATPENLRRIKKGKYTTKQVRTEPADLANTILKMANKRAKMAMVLNVTAASDCFTQDLEDMDEAMRDHLARQEAGAPASGAQAAAPALPGYSDEDFKKHMVTWRKVIASKKKDVDGVLATVATIATLTEAQVAAIRAIPASLAKEAEASQQPLTEAAILARLEKAANIDELNVAAGLINSLKDAEAVTRLNAVYDDRAQKFNN